MPPISELVLDTPVATTRRVYAALGTGDIAAVLACFAADAVFESVGDPKHLPFSGRYRGHAGLQEYFRRMAKVAEQRILEPLEIVMAGDRQVMTTGRECLRFRDTRMEARGRFAHLFTISGGYITASMEWSDTAAKLIAFRGY